MANKRNNERVQKLDTNIKMANKRNNERVQKLDKKKKY